MDIMSACGVLLLQIVFVKIMYIYIYLLGFFFFYHIFNIANVWQELS